MPSKDFVLDDGQIVRVYRRRSSRHLRLSITPAGEVRVSIPAWLPYRSGLEFARSKRSWIANQRQPKSVLQDGMPIGKAHRLTFVQKAQTNKPTTRVKDNLIIINHTPMQAFTDDIVQAVAQKACIKALRNEAEQLLPQRLSSLAEEHDFTYKSLTIKQLKSRWGSCDQHTNIVLNLFLMQLSWQLIDYVIMHELTHTRVLKHGPEFWQALTGVRPDAQNDRKNLRAHHPVLNIA